MSKIVYNKLVRTRIPNIIRQNGSEPVIKQHKTRSEEAFKLLKEKILEEAKEVFNTKADDELLEELADLQSVIDTLVLCRFGPRGKSMLDTVIDAKEITRGVFIEQEPGETQGSYNFFLNELKEVNAKKEEE